LIYTSIFEKKIFAPLRCVFKKLYTFAEPKKYMSNYPQYSKGSFLLSIKDKKTITMKKQISLVAAVLFAASILVMNGCKKDDTTPPVITLNGSSSIQHILNSPYTDPGATATDDKDGDLTASISVTNNVNKDLKGTYTVEYTVSDAAGNTASATRTVVVYNEADYLAGTYNADDTCGQSTVLPYTATITTSTTVNKKFTINNFGGFGTGTNVVMTVSGTTVGSTFSWAAQQLDAPTNSLFAATNTGSVTSTSPVTFSFSYQWSDGANTELCSSLYVKQ
jgi:hypothetical protein